MSARGARKTEASFKTSSFKPKGHKVIHNSGAGVEPKRVKIKPQDTGRRKSNEVLSTLLTKKTDGSDSSKP